MSAGEFSLIVLDSDEPIRIAETRTGIVIEQGDNEIIVPLDALEIFHGMIAEIVGDEDDGGEDEDESQPEDYDGGYGPGSYFARAMQKDD
jgi:hypothetical protein